MYITACFRMALMRREDRLERRRGETDRHIKREADGAIESMADKTSSAARHDIARALRFSFCALALAGCAQQPRETFDLATPPALSRNSLARGGAALSVPEPTAVAPTNSDRVVVRATDGSIAVLPGVQWSERLPSLLQVRLIEALQRAGLSAGRFNVAATHSLAIDVRRFEIDIASSKAVIEVDARIVNERSGAASAANVFFVESPAPENTGAPAVYALSAASADATAQIAAWARGRL